MASDKHHPSVHDQLSVHVMSGIDNHTSNDRNPDITRFKELVSGCYRRMFAIAARITGSDADGEDVVQDVLTRLWQQRQLLDEVKNPEGYMMGMTRNAAIDFSRRRKPFISIEQDLNDSQILDDVNAQESQQAITERAEEVMSALSRLSENQRKVVTLRDVEGLEMEDISHITGLTAVNVRVLLSRGRKTIRSIIDKSHCYGR